MVMVMAIGVLALQGDFEEHLAVLQKLAIEGKEVRSLDDLACVDRLILPGGESTAIGSLLVVTGLGSAIVKRVKRGTLTILGTCAGAILLAKRVQGGLPPGALALMDMTIERNAYGRQVQSFRAELTLDGVPAAHSGVFIRAPKINQVGSGVQVLAQHQGAPVLVREGRMFAATFHPEVEGDTWLHERFLSI